MVTFDLGRAAQSPAFEFQFRRLTGLVSDMSQLRSGTPVDALAGDGPLLDIWSFGKRPAACLMGLATGHPVLEGSGRPIVTSDLILLSEDRSWARTLSRWYRLGDPARPELDPGELRSWQRQ